jgi:methylase of polypeptide subunit release factors
VEQHGQTLTWRENALSRTEPWLTTGKSKPPRNVEVVDDELRAEDALRYASEGVGMLWRGDFRNARQLLDALKRRLDRKQLKSVDDPAGAFYRYRQSRTHRARILGLLLMELDEDFVLDLPRSPDVRTACLEAYGERSGHGVVSLQELLGAIGARQWRLNGVEVPALDARIYPHYGVFAPTRNEYVDLVANELTRVDVPATAFDIGTGTGVLAALLVRHGVKQVVATDNAPRAAACAVDNVRRLGITDQVAVVETDLFPAGRAELVVCNPPWLPVTPASPLDTGVYDQGGRMLATFLRDLPEHLAPGGEAWLVLSDLAELLGLRTREVLLDLFGKAGLTVLGHTTTRPDHPRSYDGEDHLAAARAAEEVTLWRLAVQQV